MNYAGKFDSKLTFDGPGAHSDSLGDSLTDSLGSHSHSVADVHVATASHAPADAIIVPDAHLLFSGDFKRAGVDLIISDHDHRVVVHEYFRGEKRPVLASPEGAPLDPKVVEALTGHVAYAQAAGDPAAAKVIGHVVKVTGSASVVRNGVTVTLNNGDNVYQNDVVQTGSSSALGLVLIDGTTFNLTASARLMLNDLVYDANSTTNASLYTLVQGAANFVAGQVAKTGDMKVATPVGTIGIRGTAVILDISSTDGKVSISVVDQQDGVVHAVEVRDPSGSVIGIVTSNGNQLTLTPTANFQVIATETGKSPQLVAQEFSAFQQVLSTYDLGKALVPTTPPPSDGKRGDNANPNQTKYAQGSTPATPPDTPVTTLTQQAAKTLAAAATTDSTGTTPPSTNTNTSGAKPAPLSTIADIIVPGAAPQPVPVLPVAIPFVVKPSPIIQVSSASPSESHFGPVMSADGRFVTYDPTGAIYLYDRQSNTTTTIASPGNGFTYSEPTISGDGHYIVYQGSNGTQSFVFFYDNNPSDANYQHTTQLLSGSSPAIDGDGGIIAVENGGSSIGVYNQQGHAIATIAPAAIGSSGTVWKPSISADGHIIAFWSSDSATAGGPGHLFTYNLSTGAITQIASTATGAGNSAASISADGHYLVYQSDAGLPTTEIYLYDLTAGRVVFSTAGVAGASYNPVISPDGHFIVFASNAQLTPDATGSVAETYIVNVTDPSHPVFQLVSASADGTAGNNASDLGATISAGGLFVAFGSSASNLTTSGTAGIFVVDPTSGNSVIINESTNSPSQLQASGVIELTGDTTDTTLSVSDLSGKFSAVLGADGNIHWTFQEPRSDFASLTPGQVSIQRFEITLTNGVTTTTVPVKVSVYDADQPPVVVVNSTLTASPGSVTADGISTTTLTVTVEDAQGNVIPDTAVTLSSTGSGDKFGAISGTTNAQGVFTTTLSSTSAQASDTITASEGGVKETVSVTFTPGGASASTSKLVAGPTSVTADGISTTTLTVTVEDAQGNVIPNTAVTLSSTGAGDKFGAISGTTNAQGVFTTTLSSTSAQASDTITASEGGVKETASVTFTPGGASALTSKLVASPTSVAADGTSTTTLTVTVEDAQGNVISGAAVSLSGSGAGDKFGAISGITNAQGVFTTTLSSTSAQASDTITASEGGVKETTSVTFTPLAPTVAPVAETGVEGSAIALNFGVTVNGAAGDSNSLATLIVSAIPVGAVLSDGTHSFTAAIGNTSVDVHSWNLSNVTIKPANDVNFTLTVAATSKDGEGNLGPTTVGTEAVTVNPLAPTVAPIAVSGVEGAAIALHLGTTVNSAAGDSNSLATLVVSAIPVGAILTDGTNTFTAAAGNTSVDVHTWTLSNLTIKPANDANFTLTVAATAKDAEGNLSATTVATEQVTVNTTVPTVAPVAGTGIEGSAIALNLGVTVDSQAGNSLATLVVSAIPVGAVLTDGSNTFTAAVGSTSVDVHSWNLSALTIKPANDANFTLTVAATAKDAQGNLSATTTGTEAVTVTPLAPTVVPVAEAGLEGSAIALNLGVTVNGLAGDSNSLTTLVVSAIPVGAVLTDGANTFTAAAGSTSVDVHSWNLSALTIKPANDVNFSLTVAATAKDAEGNLSATTTSTEAVTVNPLAPTVVPVAETGVEGSAIALNLGATVNGAAGDSNSLATLVVSAIPVGAVLTDGTNTFTAASGSTSVDVHAWNLSALAIKPANDTNFTLTVAATAKDGDGNLSTTTTSTEAVTVNPLAPTVVPVAVSGVVGSAIALNLGTTVNSAAGDSNSLATLIVSAIPVGAVLTDGTNTFTAAIGSTSVDVHSWNLSALTIKPANDANFTLTVAATAKDAEGNLSATTTSTEQVTVNTTAPTVAPVAETGIEGSAIALNLGVTVNSAAGDSLATLVVSTIPVGAVLTDGTNTFTAAVGSTSVDVHSWNLSALTIKPANDANFALTVAATAKDAGGNLGPTTTGTEQVTVNPLAPTVAPVAVSGAENSAIALNLGTTVNGLTGDSNSLATLVISAIPVGAVLSDGTNTFTAASGSTSVDVHAWNLSALTIKPANDANFTLTVAATSKDSEGNLSTTTSSTEAVTVTPLAPTVAPVAVSGIEGSAVALHLGTTVNSAAGDSNSLTTLVVSAIPVGAVLTDGTNTFTAAVGSTSVDVHSWNLSALTIKPANDANFTLTVAATAKDGEGNLSATTTSTEAVTVTPLAPTVVPVAETGVEGAAIALNLGVTVNSQAGDSNSLATLIVSAIPVGAILTDGTNTFTAAAGNTSVDVHAWNLSALTIKPANDVNFTLTVAATAKDAEGNLSTTTTGTEAVTVNPLAPTVAPVAETGVEGAAIALNLGVTVNSQAGDSNSLATLVVSAIPVGAVLTDGTNTFTAAAGSTSVDVHSWNLSALTIKPASDVNFSLTVAATAKDAEGNLSATTTSTEQVTVNTTAPTVVPVAETGIEGSAIALNLGVTVNSAAGNSLATLIVSAIPVGAVLTDGTNTFTAAIGSTSVDVHAWNLSALTIKPANDANFTLTVAATAKDAEGNLSTTTTGTEAVTVNPLAPAVVPVAETGIEGSAIALNLGTTVNGLTGDSNSLATLVVSAIPVGAVLTDGSNTFTAASGSTSVDVHSWNLSALTIKPANDANFTLTVAATAKDAEGNLSATTTATEAVTVNPLAPTVAPVAVSGVEGSAIALHLGTTVNSAAGDSNSLATLVVSAIPVGAVLTDGTNTFTAAIGSTSVDVHAWNLSALTIKPANDANFSLTVAATSKDGEGNLSTTTSSTEAVTVTPLAPTVAPVAVSGIEGSAIALNLGTTVNSATGDSNSLATLVVSAIPVGAVLTDGTNTFTAAVGSTSVDVHTWNLSALTIKPANDANFSLTVAATSKDGEGNLSTTTSSTEAVTVTPLAPTVAPVAVSGVEGSAIALNLGTTVNSATGDSNSLATLVVSAIPVGAVLTDGTNTFTAAVGSTSVDVHSWNLSALTIKPANDVNFSLTVAATSKDGEGNLSTTTSSTEAVTVTPLAPTVAPVAETGLEGSAIALNLGTTVNGATGDSNSLATLVVSAIPVGAVLTDGTNTFTAAIGSTSVDVHSWNLSALTIKPANDVNFTLTVAATSKDGEGNLSTTTSSTEAVTVNPLAPTVAPVAVSGVEGSAIALHLGTTVNSATGDSNSLATLVVSAIPVGAVLTDGTNTFTAAVGSTSVDVHTWNLSALTIKPANDANFSLTVAATAKDAEGNLSTTTTSTEVVAVNPAAPTVVPVAASGLEGTAIALNLGVAATNLGGDGNTLNSVTISGIPAGATLSNSNGALTVAGGSITFNATQLVAGVLGGLKITPANDVNFTLNVSAQQQDGNGDLSTTTTSTELVTVNPTAPTVVPVTVSGLQGTPIVLNLGIATTGLSGDSNSLNSVTISGIPAGATLSNSSGALTVSGGTITLNATQLASGALSGLKITPANGASFALTVTATEKDADNNVSTSTTATEQVNVTAQAIGYLWGTSVIPEANSHLFNPIGNVNTAINTGALLFGTTPSLGFNANGPDTITLNVGLFDPFGLAYRSGIQPIETSTTQLPIKYQIMMPVTASGPEAMAFYSTQTGGISTIYQAVVSEPASGPNGNLTDGAPTVLEQNLSGGLNTLYTSYTNVNASDVQTSAMTSYSVAWGVYNTSTLTYQAQFQIFPTGGSASVIGTIESLSNLAAVTSAPAWEFRSAGGLSDHGVSVPYASVVTVADGTHAGQQDIQFQGYNADGSVNNDVKFLITPDLTNFLPGATNQITQPSNGATLLFTPNGVAGSGFSAAWSETVTDGNGTHTQVEFAIFKASGFNASNQFGSGSLISQSTFQLPSNATAQNIRIGSSSVGGASVEYLAYGDTNSTTVVEFDATGHQIATITDSSHPGVIYNDFAILGDGRITLSYADNNSAQVTTDIYDLRQTGLNLSDSASTSSANYVAGTEFSDIFIGGNNASNFYEFIGSPSAIPTDAFTGGVGSFNEALFTDARSSFTIALDGNGNATIQSNDSAHGGTLDTSNVQALAFGASSDPSPSSSGGLEVTSGETLVMLGNFANGNTYPVTIDSGGTLEIMPAGSVEAATFAATGATLRLDYSQSYTGTVSGFVAGDTIDLADITYSPTVTDIWNSANNTLTINDGAHTTTLKLAGSYTQDSFALKQDSGTGTKVVLATVAQDDTISQIAFNENTGTTIAASVLLANDTDPNGGTLAVTAVSAASAHGGTVTLNGNVVSYTPAANYTGADSFTYTVSDGAVTSTATVNFNVAPVGPDVAPSIAGDLSVITVKGGGVQLTGLATAVTTADLQAVDPDSTPAQLVFTVTATNHGHVASSATGPAITSFTQAQLNSGAVFFVADSPTYIGQGSFTVSVSDGIAAPTAPTPVGVTFVDAQISVLTAGGYNFDQDNALGAMGSGLISAVTPTTFTITNTTADRDFTVTGSGFVYDPVAQVFTAGTITSILETTDASHTQLAKFDLYVPAVDWMNAAVALANGDQSVIEALTSPWTFNFIGGAGADAFKAGDQNDIFTGRAGNDALSGGFGYDRANYGAATAGINVQLADGIVTGDASVGTDTLQSIELVTGSEFADTFNAGPTISNPGGFSATSTNAGSTVTANVAGLFNEFEGRGGNDTITGNGQTRISYYHATAGVVVTFNPNSWTSLTSGASGTATGNASVGTDTFTGVNNVRGSFFNDSFTGSTNPFSTAENFEGLGGNDIINGGGGFDRAVYEQASDGIGIIVNLADGTVTGGPDTGSDTLISVEGIYGTEFADIYNAGATTLNPGGFSPTSTNAGSTQTSATNSTPTNFNEFEGAGGNDTVTGNGNTRVAYYHATGGVVVTLGSNGSGTSTGNASVGTDTFVSGVNAVNGSEFNDIITGNGGNNFFNGENGNDVLIGNGGNDTLTGGAGSDIFVFRVGVTDGNSPATNNDTITDFTHSDGDRIDLRSIASIHSLSDILSLGAPSGSNTVFTFSSTDPTSLTLQNVTMANLTASDFIFSGQVAVTVQTPDGYDFSTLYDDLAVSNPIQAANDGTHVFAVDTAKGITFEMIGTGFTYDGTTHLVNGGTITEIDILNTTDPTQTTQDHVLVNTNGWSISASALFSDIGAYAGNHSGPGLTALNTIFNAATYNIVGSAGVADNSGPSHNGADVFFGGNQADVFNGMPGPFGPNDPGSDTVDYSHATTGLVANLANPASNTGAAAGDIYISIENLRGTAGNDTLTGDGNNNVLEGGLGNNTLNGGGGSNTASYEHATAGVTVDLTISGPQNTIGAGTDTLVNIQNVLGSSFNDTLKGNGNSVLEGGPGNDTLIGQAGQNDTASYEHATAGVTVNLALSGPQATGGAGSDTLTNIANLMGSHFDDTLTGNTGNNTFFGNGGNDTFVFNESLGIGHDTIGDFNPGQDHIQLDYAAFNANVPNSFATWLASHATTSGSDVLIDLNVDGPNVDTILLKNVALANLSANDFILHPNNA